MTKDRLKALQSVLQETGRDGADDIGLGVVNTTVDIEDENAGYMEHFFAEVVQIREWISEINENVSAIKALQSKLLSSPRPDEGMKQDLDSRSETVKGLSKKVNSGLKGLERAINQEEGELALPADAKLPAGLRIRKTQHSTTLYLFVEAIKQFNSVQVEYKEKCEERMQRVISIAKANVTDEKLEQLLEQGNFGAIFNDDIITETLEVRRALEDVQIRHEELLKLEKSIKELHDLFLEMAVLVETQGELINQIEKHVQNAGEYIVIGEKQINLATKYKDKARVKKICLLTILAVILVSAILIFVFWPKK